MVCDRTHIVLRHAYNQTGHPFRVRWVWPETAHSFAELTLFICEMADPAGDVWQMGSAIMIRFFSQTKVPMIFGTLALFWLFLGTAWPAAHTFLWLVKQLTVTNKSMKIMWCHEQNTLSALTIGENLPAWSTNARMERIGSAELSRRSASMTKLAWHRPRAGAV